VYVVCNVAQRLTRLLGLLVLTMPTQYLAMLLQFEGMISRLLPLKKRMLPKVAAPDREMFAKVAAPGTKCLPRLLPLTDHAGCCLQGGKGVRAGTHDITTSCQQSRKSEVSTAQCSAVHGCLLVFLMIQRVVSQHALLVAHVQHKSSAGTGKLVETQEIIDPQSHGFVSAHASNSVSAGCVFDWLPSHLLQHQ
jgi:hypothetical protein